MTKRVKDRIAPVTFPIGSEGAGGHLHGVVDIDYGLVILVNDILNQTGIQKLDTGAKLEQIIYTDQWRDFRHAFQGDCHFTFGVENDLKHDGDGRYSIRGNMITISRYLADVTFLFTVSWIVAGLINLQLCNRGTLRYSFSTPL